MRIAYVLSSCVNSGPFIVARDIINNISGSVDPIDIYYIKESNEKLHFNARLTKVSLFEKKDLSAYDVVHSHGLQGDAFAYLNRKSIKGKWISTLHQDIGPSYTLYYGKIVGGLTEKAWCYLVSKSQTVVTLTAIMAGNYRRIIHRTKIVPVHNGTSPVVSSTPVPEAAALDALKSKYTTMGISASLLYLKGIDRVIEALAHPTGKDLALIVVGGGKLDHELKDLAATLNVKDRCIFLGYKSNAIDYFKYFDVYVMSSRTEGFGLCVIEAASQGIPLVCNDLPVYHELFEADEIVRFSLADTGSLTSAVIKANSERSVYGAKGLARYRKDYTAEAMAANYMKVYRG